MGELSAAFRGITREEGMSAQVVEQHAHKILGVTDEAVILERGAVVHAAPSAALRSDPAALERHLGVSKRGAVPPAPPRPTVQARLAP